MPFSCPKTASGTSMQVERNHLSLCTLEMASVMVIFGCCGKKMLPPHLHFQLHQYFLSLATTPWMTSVSISSWKMTRSSSTVTKSWKFTSFETQVAIATECYNFSMAISCSVAAASVRICQFHRDNVCFLPAFHHCLTTMLQQLCQWPAWYPLFLAPHCCWAWGGPILEDGSCTSLSWCELCQDSVAPGQQYSLRADTLPESFPSMEACGFGILPTSSWHLFASATHWTDSVSSVTTGWLGNHKGGNGRS